MIVEIGELYIQILSSVFMITFFLPFKICEFQVEQAQAGLESLSLSQKTINHLQENFVEIEKYEYYERCSYTFALSFPQPQLKVPINKYF